MISRNHHVPPPSARCPEPGARCPASTEQSPTDPRPTTDKSISPGRPPGHAGQSPWHLDAAGSRPCPSCHVPAAHATAACSLLPGLLNADFARSASASMASNKAWMHFCTFRLLSTPDGTLAFCCDLEPERTVPRTAQARTAQEHPFRRDMSPRTAAWPGGYPKRAPCPLPYCLAVELAQLVQETDQCIPAHRHAGTCSSLMGVVCRVSASRQLVTADARPQPGTVPTAGGPILSLLPCRPHTRARTQDRPPTASTASTAPQTDPCTHPPMSHVPAAACRSSGRCRRVYGFGLRNTNPILAYPAAPRRPSALSPTRRPVPEAEMGYDSLAQALSRTLLNSSCRIGRRDRARPFTSSHLLRAPPAHHTSPPFMSRLVTQCISSHLVSDLT